LAEAFPYLILNARYERVREAGVIASHAVLIAIGIDWDGRRQMLAVELANREKPIELAGLPAGAEGARPERRRIRGGRRSRGAAGRAARGMAEAAYQRCYVHFLRNALDYVPRRVDDDSLQELRWLYDRRDLAEARRDLAAWLAKWSDKYAKLTRRVEENIDETLTFYRLPRQHHKHLKSTNMLEQLNEEIKRRTHVVRIFPNAELSAADAGACGRDPRELARTASLPQHGRSTRAQKRRVASWLLGQPPWAASGSADNQPLGELGV
jgi:putative transposase